MGKITRVEILTSKRQKRDARRRGGLKKGDGSRSILDSSTPRRRGEGTKNFAKYFFKYLSRLGGNGELPLSLIPMNGEGSQRIIRVESADGLLANYAGI